MGPFEAALATGMDIGMQMQQTRMVAEQAVATPDFGAVQAAGQKPRTATEMNLVGSVMGQSTDLRARIFRRELGRLLQMSWALLLQYGKTAPTISTWTSWHSCPSRH